VLTGRARAAAAAGSIAATVAIGAIAVAVSSGGDAAVVGSHAQATVDADDTTESGGTSDSDEAHAHAHDRDETRLQADASSEERAAAAALVDATRDATQRYVDVAAALDAGYRPNPAGGPNATHHPSPALMRDGRVLDPEVPESLMYWTARDGTKVLVGAVFKTRPGEDAPAPGGALTMWHTHARGEMCHPAEDASCPQDTGKMLHVFFFEGVQDPFAENVVAAAGGRRAFALAMAARR
jgi:hypothetical protein